MEMETNRNWYCPVITMSGVFLDDGRELYEVNILSHRFDITTAEDDFNPEKKTLFATKLWEGAKIMGEHILTNRQLFEGQAIIEFGAGAGLPSLCASIAGAQYVCCSDYPVENVLLNIQDNINRCFSDITHNIRVAGFKWGEDAVPLLTSLALAQGLSSDSEGQKFDVAIAAECLWRHDSHDILLQSLTQCVRPGGIALISFSHHIPGLEKDDLSFFDNAVSYGWEIEERIAKPAKHMWSDRIVDMNIFTLRKL